MSGYYDRTGKYHPPGSTPWHSTGRSGGWWTYAAPRPSSGIGISPELPTGRAVGWNAALVAVEVAAAVTAHVGFAVPWWQLAAAFAAVLAFGGGLLVYVVIVATPRVLRRHQALLRAHLLSSQLPAGDASTVGPAGTPTTRTSTSGSGRAA